HFFRCRGRRWSSSRSGFFLLFLRRCRPCGTVGGIEKNYDFGIVGFIYVSYKQHTLPTNYIVCRYMWSPFV
ncbi:hypothetical protein ACVGWI_05840, partial [Enterobacter hormaechei]